MAHLTSAARSCARSSVPSRQFAGGNLAAAPLVHAFELSGPFLGNNDGHDCEAIGLQQRADKRG
jgi:hypothetical protein